MRRSFKKASLPFILLIFSLLSALKLHPQELRPRVVVVKENAVLRISPSEDSPIIRKIPVGTILEVDKSGWAWLKVKLPADKTGISLTGYIQESFVSYWVEKIPEPEEKKEPEPPKVVTPQKPVTPPLPPKKPPVAKEEEKKEKAGVPVMVKRHKLLSLCGGMGWDNVNGGDLNELIRDTNAFYTDSNNHDYIEFSSEWNEMGWLNNYRGEVILNILPYVGIGLGVDYMMSVSQGTLTQSKGTENTVTPGLGYYYLRKVVYESQEQPEYRLRVIPISLNLHLSLPLSQIFNAIFSGGIGYYLGSLELRTPYHIDYDYSDTYYYDSGTFWHEWTDNWDQTGTYTEEARSQAIGVHGSIGIDLKVTRNVSFIFEGVYKVVNFTKWDGSFSHAYDWNTESGWSDVGVKTQSGKESESESGKLWYSELYYDYLAKYYADMNVSSDAPTPGVGIRNIRLAAINLNGFSVKWGIKISF